MKIYVDMDQVLVDFCGGTKEILGRDFGLLGSDTEVDDGRRCVSPTFWQNLPPMPDYRELWTHVDGKYEAYVLSAYPNWEDPYVFVGKRAWLKQYLLVPEHRVHIVARHEKAQFAIHGDVRNILIDDREKNCQEFIAAGGLAILHQTAQETIRELENILNR